MDRTLRILGVVALAEAIIFMTVTMVALVVIGVGLNNALDEPTTPTLGTCDVPHIGDGGTGYESIPSTEDECDALGGTWGES
jgi:hypothetical protein